MKGERVGALGDHPPGVDGSPHPPHALPVLDQEHENGALAGGVPRAGRVGTRPDAGTVEEQPSADGGTEKEEERSGHEDPIGLPDAIS